MVYAFVIFQFSQSKGILSFKAAPQSNHLCAASIKRVFRFPTNLGRGLKINLSVVGPLVFAAREASHIFVPEMKIDWITLNSVLETRLRGRNNCFP